MTRGQRRVHAVLWPLLALAVAGLIGAGLHERGRVVEAAETVEAG